MPHERGIGLLREHRRGTRTGWMLASVEHNPRNPLTVRTVDRCPFDENARLIKAKEFVARCRESGWKDPKAQFHLFFPHALSGLRTLEPYLSGIPFGGQYSVTAIKSD